MGFAAFMYRHEWVAKTPFEFKPNLQFPNINKTKDETSNILIRELVYYCFEIDKEI